MGMPGNGSSSTDGVVKQLLSERATATFRVIQIVVAIGVAFLSVEAKEHYAENANLRAQVAVEQQELAAYKERQQMHTEEIAANHVAITQLQTEFQQEIERFHDSLELDLQKVRDGLSGDLAKTHDGLTANLDKIQEQIAHESDAIDKLRERILCLEDHKICRTPPG